MTEPAPDLPGASSPQRRAVIDVGTNSVKLLVADCRGLTVEPVVERSVQTRLGEGFFATRQLLPAAIARTVEAAAAFRVEAGRQGARELRTIATAAAREALNAHELLDALRRDAALDVEVISGETEATLAFRGVCSTLAFESCPLLVTDLGGGSTEFIVGQAGQRRYSRSFPLGAVRLLERLQLPDDPAPSDLNRCRVEVDSFLQREVVPEVAPVLREASVRQPITYVGVGGTAVILARILHGLADYDRPRIEQSVLRLDALTGIVERLWSLPLGLRRQVPGLPPERADVMLTGAVVHERILVALGLDAVRPSTRGLRFGALQDRSGCDGSPGA